MALRAGAITDRDAVSWAARTRAGAAVALCKRAELLQARRHRRGEAPANAVRCGCTDRSISAHAALRSNAGSDSVRFALRSGGKDALRCTRHRSRRQDGPLRADVGDEELEDWRGRLVGAVRAPQLLHGLVRRPRQLQCDVQPPPLILHAPVGLRTSWRRSQTHPRLTTAHLRQARACTPLAREPELLGWRCAA